MGDIATRVLEQRVAELEAMVLSQRAQIVALLFEAGKGKRVSISKGKQREADKAIGWYEPKRLSSGELRFEVGPPEEANGG